MNPFNRLDPQKLELQKIEQEVRAELKSISAVAQDLLLDGRYQRFANLVKEAQENTVELLLRYKEADPYKYKAQVDEFLVELRVYRNILTSAKDLAAPKENPQINFVQKFKGDIKEILGRIK